MMGIYFAVPGPWKNIRPLVGMTFQTGSAETSIQVADMAPAAGPDGIPKTLVSGSLPVAGEIPEQGDWTLRVKRHLVRARPILHSLLFFGPTFWICWWIGRRPALFLMLGMALAIELAQVGFGYGFGWDDVLDLFNDTIGIFLALWAHRRFEKWRRS